MLWIFKAGGFPMVFITLFGGAAFIVAILLASRPNERRLEVVRFLSRATLFAVGAGICSSLAAVFVTVSKRPEFARSPDIHLIVMQGLGESMAPGILGFTLLSITAFLTALGVRKMRRPEQ